MPESNAYQPPTADISPAAGPPLSAKDEFYPTSVRKLTLLFFCSMGFYPFYWMYQNWKRLAPEWPVKIRPFWRAVFFIFFTHELFREIRRRAGDRKLPTGWNPEILATAFVLLEVFSRVIARASEKFEGYEWLSYTQFFFLVAQYFPLAAVQRTANNLNNDPEGALNSRYNLINILIIVAGALLYLFVILSLGIAF
jgi:hypothetical protein